MLIFGDNRLLCDKKFKIIDDLDSLKLIENGSIPFFTNIKDQIDFTYFCIDNDISYAVLIKDLNEAIYASIQRASFLMVEKELAKQIQELAENYMFDAKVVQIIDKEDEIKKVALAQIDAVVYRSSIWK